jgi:hypothetical protein
MAPEGIPRRRRESLLGWFLFYLASMLGVPASVSCVHGLFVSPELLVRAFIFVVPLAYLAALITRK